eukprot:2100610-Heterocapsa_arctica.AAC.1
MTKLGYAVELTDRQVDKEFPEAHVAKLGLLVKERADGVLKVRLIVDMLRSKANAKALIPERGILPRPTDPVYDALELLAATPRARESSY